MSEEIEFEIPTWSQIHNMLIKQSEKILTNGFQPDIIIGIARGGWVPARLLSDLLGVNNISSIKVEFYLDVEKTRKKPILIQKLPIRISNKRVLLVDDVADTGMSLQLAKTYLLSYKNIELKIATIYKKPKSRIEPDYYEKITKNWIVFPWEIKEISKKIIKERKQQHKKSKSKKNNFTEELFSNFIKDSDEGNS